MTKRYLTVSDRDASIFLSENAKLVNWLIGQFPNALWCKDEVRSLVLEAVVRALGKYKPEEGSFANFALFIARRLIKDAREAHFLQLNNRVNYDGVEWSKLSGIDEQSVNNTNIDIDKLLSTLSARDRDIIISRRIYEIDARIIAEKYNITQQRVSQLEKKAMIKLQEIVKQK